MTATKVNVDIVFPTISACRGPHTRGRCCTHTHFPLAFLIAAPLLQHKNLWLRHTFSWHALLLSMITVINMIIIMIFFFFELKVSNSVLIFLPQKQPIQFIVRKSFPFYAQLNEPFNTFSFSNVGVELFDKGFDLFQKCDNPVSM